MSAVQTDESSGWYILHSDNLSNGLMAKKKKLGSEWHGKKKTVSQHFKSE